MSNKLYFTFILLKNFFFLYILSATQIYKLCKVSNEKCKLNMLTKRKKKINKASIQANKRNQNEYCTHFYSSNIFKCVHIATQIHRHLSLHTPIRRCVAPCTVYLHIQMFILHLNSHS